VQRNLPPFEAGVGLLAGLALLSLGSALTLALDPGARAVAVLGREPALWVLGFGPVLFGGLGWIVGDQRLDRARAHRQYQHGMEEEFARLASREFATRAVVAASPDAVLVVDGDGNVVDANPQAERMFGTAPDALLGLPSASLLPDRPTLVPGVETADGMEVALARHTDGTAFRVELRTTRLDDPPVRIVTLREDVLRSQLEASRIALERNAGRERQESRVRNHVLLDVDRGLREDLLKVLRAAEDLRARGVAAEPVLVAAFAMLERLERLLDLTLWDRAAGRPTRVPVPVVELFDHVNLILAPLAQRWGRSVLLDLDPDLGEVPTDSSLVAGAVRALVREVLTRSGGDVVIEVGREPGRDHDWLLVTVALGAQLPEAEAERLTSLLEASPSTLPTGTDAALVLGQRLARHLDGRITLRREFNERGTTFALVIPLATPGRVRPSKVPVARTGHQTTPPG